MRTILDATNTEQFLGQTDLNGSAAGGTANPFANISYTSIEVAMQAILDFANNDLAAIQTTMAGITNDFATIQTAWDTLIQTTWPTELANMQTEVDDWLAKLSGSLSADGRILIKKTPNNQLNWMYVLPKRTYEQARPDLALGTGVQAAFIHNAGEYDQIAIDMFLPSLVDGELVSQPGRVPYVNKNRDEFKTLFAAQQFDEGVRKLWTVHDRAALLLETHKIGHNVLGNSAYGVSHDDTFIAGVCPTGIYTLTGSMGPQSSHNGLSAGVYDLTGNVWEWVDGFELTDSEAFMIANNDPAGAMVTTGEFMNVATHANSQVLQRAGIVSSGDANEKGNYWVTHTGQRGLIVGAHWAAGAAAGPFARSLSSAPSYRHSGISARGALVI